MPLTWLRKQKVLLQLIRHYLKMIKKKALAEAVDTLVLSGTASQQLKQLFALSPVIDAFFENTMVMAEDEAVRQNRLAILSQLTQKASKLARFSQINTK